MRRCRTCPAIKPRALIEALESRLLFSAPDASWKLVWSDEFNGKGLDRHKWSVGVPWTGPDGSNRLQSNNYLSYISESDVQVAGGTLNLLTEKRDVTGASGATYHYTEGAIHSADSFAFQYGYVEIRAQIPVMSGPGAWGAFWMLASGWPPEDDVLEYWTSTNRLHQGLAYQASDGVHWDDTNSFTPLPTGFHTYGMEWGPGYQIFTMDGLITHTVKGSFVPDEPMYLLLNNSIEAAHPPTAATVFPNALQVDYVRVYKHAGAPQVSNGGFEEGALGLWDRLHTAQVVSDATHGGSYALRTQGAGSQIEQTISGLMPSTPYVLAGWARTLDATDQARIGVKDYGGSDASTSTRSGQFTMLSVPFTTGPTSTSATIYGLQDAGALYAWFDDFTLHRAAQIDNGSFETGTLAGWDATDSASITHGRGKSGAYALFEASAGATAQQTMYGLAPNTTYRLTGWARASAPGVVASISVKDFGAADVSGSVAVTRYQQASLLFTTGPSATTATISCDQAGGPGPAWFDALSLSGPVELTLSPIRAQTLRSGRTKSVRFTLAGAIPSAPPSLSVISSDPGVISSQQVIFGGSDTRPTLLLEPTPDQSGTATLTLIARDRTGRQAPQSFIVNVRR